MIRSALIGHLGGRPAKGCVYKPLSLVSLGVGSRVTRGENVLWVC